MNRKAAMTAVFTILFAAASGASDLLYAVEIANSTEGKVGAAILVEHGEVKQPVYIKLLEPGQEISFNPEIEGPYVVSVADMETKETQRVTGVRMSDRVTFDGDTLKVN